MRLPLSSQIKGENQIVTRALVVDERLKGWEPNVQVLVVTVQKEEGDVSAMLYPMLNLCAVRMKDDLGEAVIVSVGVLRENGNSGGVEDDTLYMYENCN
jgi:hypothetical protein